MFWLCCVACGILVPQPGIEPAPPAVEAQSLNHWTAREVPIHFFLLCNVATKHFKLLNVAHMLSLSGSAGPEHCSLPSIFSFMHKLL